MQHCLSLLSLTHVHPNPTTPCFNHIIHITGTKGKGSTAAMTESILNQNNLHTALFTSPHLVSPRERIRIDGLPISELEFSTAFFKVQDLLSATPNIGYFRLLTLLSLYVFANHRFPDSKPIDVLILEVGIGGEYDATNLFSHSVASCITRLDLDHCRVLGSTLELIAREKSGIFRKGAKVFTVEQHDEGAMRAIKFRGKERNVKSLEVISPETMLFQHQYRATGAGTAAEIEFSTLPNRALSFMTFSWIWSVLGRLISIIPISIRSSLYDKFAANRFKLFGGAPAPARAHAKIELGMKGDYQYENAALAVKMSRVLLESLDQEVDLEAEKMGLERAIWPGRCQKVSDKEGGDVYYLDGAHTLKSIEVCCDWFWKDIAKSATASATATHKNVLMFNCSHERDPIKILHIAVNGPGGEDCSFFDDIVFTKSNSERPSKIPVPSVAELVEGRARARAPDSCKEELTWQQTLKSAFHIIYPASTTKVHVSGSVTSALRFLESNKQSNNKHKHNNILCTGSLLLVGSFLEEINWTEDNPRGHLYLL